MGLRGELLNYVAGLPFPNEHIEKETDPSKAATTGGINCEYLITNHWSIKAGINLMSGTHMRHDNWPFWVFDNPPGLLVNPIGALFDRLQEYPSALGKEGFGMYRHNDEMYFIFRYRF